MAKKPLIKIIKRFTSALTERGITVDKIILYGSHARGKARLNRLLKNTPKKTVLHLNSNMIKYCNFKIKEVQFC